MDKSNKEILSSFYLELFTYMELMVDIAVTEIETEDGHFEYTVAVTGDNLGNLIGRSGNRLESLEYLGYLCLQNEKNEGHRVTLDINNYQEYSLEKLTRLTDRLTKKVLETGESISLRPMSNAKRRIIHNLVNKIDGVETVSEGTASNRHIIIKPAKNI